MQITMPKWVVSELLLDDHLKQMLGSLLTVASVQNAISLKMQLAKFGSLINLVEMKGRKT